ncbi:type II toxin-antitoxin system Phd/YefM family antitoxin [Amnibacterium sp.]|uniref:type II toxin-antitoxin system Phd/YefM family antitoxin n=1 Tax=Amnibacterium sp. TaxID=1872496 RepID=UPI003F7C49E9
MIVVDVHEAKTGLSKLIAKVEAGEQVVIARAGKPVVELVMHRLQGIRFGTAAGLITIRDDAFAWPDEQIARQLYGDE